MPARNKIYVQIDIRGTIEQVWHLTQTPQLHQCWDLRFTEITYLPRTDAAEPQRFLYSTRIGFGLNIGGEGETVGNGEGINGEHSSALKFWSDDPKSLIREGSGYWKYIPGDNENSALRFLTLYDYTVRFGLLGRLIDRVVFRPAMSWATAWSFDRLRLWIEKGIHPAASMRRALAYLIARLTLGFVWFYQGLIPKLIYHHPHELAMIRTLGVTNSTARSLATTIGWIEIGIGLAMVFAWRFTAPIWITLIAMPVALVGVAVNSPGFLIEPFNPVSLNLSVFAIAAIALLMNHDLPSARQCVRQIPGTAQ